jgi:amino acid transporter
VQVGWFSWLSRISSAAAAAALFGSYVEGILPGLANWHVSALLTGLMLGVLALMNYVGVKVGARVSTVTLIARLVPLALLIAIALPILVERTSARQMLSIEGHPGANWFEALLLISFLFGGYETAMMALGEVKDPRRSAPFALGIGMFVCIVVYTLCQWVVVDTIGASPTPRPLADAARQVMGNSGALLISLAALVSTVGYLSACVLNVPRLMFAISEQGDFPRWFSRVHPTFKTPHVAIITFGVLVFILAATGGFRFSVMISAGARLITYGSVCAALMPLRRKDVGKDMFRMPFGPLLSIIGVLMALIMVSSIRSSGAIVMLITSAVALGNWLFARRRESLKVAA